MIAAVIFWLGVVLLFHSYVLYPKLLQWLSAGKKENEIVFERTDENLPQVFIAFAVYNEEKVIRESWKVFSILITQQTNSTYLSAQIIPPIEQTK